MQASEPNGGGRAGHVLIIGGSMVGLATAAALHEHAERVTIVERDELPVEGANRRGVPQGHHNHALMTGGRAALDQLLPGFTQQMQAGGALLVDQPRDIAFLTAQGWLTRAPTGVETFFVRRQTLEAVVRSMVRKLANVTITQGTVNGLLATPDNTHITGVTLEDTDNNAKLQADLVIDASGRGSKAPKWLTELGYQPPQEVQVQPYLGYASRLLKIPEEAWPDGLYGVIALPYPGATRGAAVTKQDNGFSILTACGAGRDYPPGEEDGLDAFLQSTMTPVLHQIVNRSEPLSPITTTRTSMNRLRCYHQLTQRPTGFLAIGDALCALNPAYGQGMTTGALQAQHLKHLLTNPTLTLNQITQQFPTDILNLNSFAWGVATSADMAFPTTDQTGLPQPTEEDIQTGAYMQKLQRAATADAWLVGQLQGAIGSLNPTPLFTQTVRQKVQTQDQQPQPPWATNLNHTPPLQPPGTP